MSNAKTVFGTKLAPFLDIASRFRCLFFDAYGVLNGAGGMFPWVHATFLKLTEMNIPFYVVSNDPANSIAEVAAKISPEGQQAVVRESQIIGSGLICEPHVAEHLAGQRLVYLGEKRSTGYLQAASEVV